MTATAEIATSPTSSTSYAPPRHRVSDGYEPSGSRGAVAVALAARRGQPAQAWQADMLMDWGARTPDGTRYAHQTLGASIPRQAGKSDAGIDWVVSRVLYDHACVLWSDHNYSTTCEMLRRFREIFGSRPRDPTARNPRFNAYLAGVNWKTAQESMYFRGGGSLHFSTRTKSAALGYSFDMVVIDEAQEYTAEQQQAIMPTTTSGSLHDLQVLYLGTPPRPHGYGTVFQKVRSKALDRALGGACWWEWGVAEVGDVHDESRWYSANPSLSAGVSDIEAIRTACDQMDELAFAQEYLGYWLPGASADLALDPAAWDACEVPAHVAEGIDGIRALGVKFSPDGRTIAVSIGVRPPEGDPYVELYDVADATLGASAIADWVVSRRGSWSCVAIDGRDGATALGSELVRRGMRGRREVVVCTATDAQTAASTLVYRVRDHAVRHMASPALDASAKGSIRRRIGKGGGFGFGDGDGCPSAPLESAALALWAALTTRRNPGRRAKVW